MILGVQPNCGVHLALTSSGNIIRVSCYDRLHMRVVRVLQERTYTYI
jgi:hypothetical protein